MSPNESLTVYIRRPGDPEPPSPDLSVRHRTNKNSPLLSRRIPSSPSESIEDQLLPPFAPRRLRKTPDLGISDKVEIDSDNIETPPATRKLVGIKPRQNDENSENKLSRTHSKENSKHGEEDEMGDGQFDRFSSTRRTRRYRKSAEEEPVRRTEVVSPELVSEKQIIRPTTLQVQSYPVTPLVPQDSESRLKKWQDRLKYKGNDVRVEEDAITTITKSGEELQNLDKSSTLPRTSRHRTGIARKDVLEAFNKLKENPDEIFSPAKNESPSFSKFGSSSTLPRSARHRSNIDHTDVTQALRKYGLQQDAPIVIDPKLKLSKDHLHDTENSKTEKKIEKKKDDVCSRLKDDHHGLKPVIVQVQDSNSKVPSRLKSEFIPEIRVQATTPSKQRTEHELNDEGFEETQSLVSETPSQGTSSGCNYEGDSIDSPKGKTKVIQLNRADSSGSGDTSCGVPSRTKITRTNSVNLPERKSVIPRSSSLRKTDSQASLTRLRKTDSQASLTRMRKTDSQASLNRQNSKSLPRTTEPRRIPISSRFTETSKKETTPSKSTSNSLIRRQGNLDRSTPRLNSMLKTSQTSNGAQPRKRVERSNSRSSLRSSRSSLNSATSVSTVRVRPVPGISGYTNAIKTLTTDLRKSTTAVKKPLAPVQLKSRSSIPASRSSSSGSSIGPTIRRPKVTSGISTSFKENAVSVPASRSSSSGSSIGPVKRAGQGFMRPTASSAAKDSIEAPRTRPSFRQSLK